MIVLTSGEKAKRTSGIDTSKIFVTLLGGQRVLRESARVVAQFGTIPHHYTQQQTAKHQHWRAFTADFAL